VTWLSELLFKLTKNLMGHKGEIILLSCSFDKKLATKFSDFFMTKIITSRNAIDSHDPPKSDTVVMTAEVEFKGQTPTQFTRATHDEVHDIILKSPSRSCELHSGPTTLLIHVLEYLKISFITAIIKKSFVEFKVTLLDNC